MGHPYSLKRRSGLRCPPSAPYATITTFASLLSGAPKPLNRLPLKAAHSVNAPPYPSIKRYLLCPSHPGWVFPSIISISDRRIAAKCHSSQPWASLSPQEVNVVSTQFDNNGYAYPNDNTWIQIHTTWLGNMWIKVENTKIGVIRPMNADLNLKVATPLYDHPYREAANGAILSPQTVHAKAEFVSPSGLYAIQIETAWLGDRWLTDYRVSKGGELRIGAGKGI